MKIQPIRGTHDLFGENLLLYNFVEKTVSNLAEIYDYKQIITPIFENTDLFKKPLGENSEIVLKEMYSFKDLNESSLSDNVPSSPRFPDCICLSSQLKN